MTSLPNANAKPNNFPANPSRVGRSWIIGLTVVVLAGLSLWLLVFGPRSAAGKSSKEQAEHGGNKQSGATKVEIVSPKQGGIARVCVQPGTVEPFESTDEYAKVSGFLIDTVDIDQVVKKGDVLAHISVPEYEQQVAKDKALVANAGARVRQMEAHVKAAQAEEKARLQMIKQAKILMKSKAVYRSFRMKELERIKTLHAMGAVEAKLVDEYTDHYEAAVEAENAAVEGVTTAELKWESAKAKELQAEADLEESKSAIDVATAELEKAKVLLDYSVIRSPFDGVVTRREFCRGAAIRAFDGGGAGRPVVSVDRTDKLRVVVQVPDSDVPYVDVGDTATVQIDALSDTPFEARIARSAQAEDPQTRTMRVEIDLPNPTKKLIRNMYGRVTLRLAEGTPSALRIPTAALFSRDGSHGKVRIVRDHHIHTVPVEVGTDNGVEVEIVKGLVANDHVVLRASGPAEEGTEVVETGSSMASSH